MYLMNGKNWRGGFRISNFYLGISLGLVIEMNSEGFEINKSEEWMNEGVGTIKIKYWNNKSFNINIEYGGTNHSLMVVYYYNILYLRCTWWMVRTGE